MRSTLACLLALTFALPNTAGAIGIVSEHDLQILMAGGAGYRLYRVTQEINGIAGEINAAAADLEAEARRLDADAAQMMDEAKTIETGGAKAQSATPYTSKMATGEGYRSVTQSANKQDELAKNTNRLNADGAEKLGAQLAKNKTLQGKQITITLETAHGTMNSSLTKGQPIVIRGTVEEAVQGMMKAVAAQNPTAGPGSIVQMSYSYEEAIEPNPKLAEQMRAKATGLTAEADAERAKVEPRLREIKGKYQSKLARLKRWRGGMVGVIALAIFIEGIRASYAQTMVTLAEACEDQDQLETNVEGFALQSGRDRDEVWYEIASLCAQ